MSRARPTIFGWLVLIGAALSFVGHYRPTIGVWTFISLSYLYGTYIFSEMNYRFFAPTWPVILLLLVLPADILFARLRRNSPAALPAGKPLSVH